MFDEFKNAFQRPNNGHVQLIVLNILVFVTLAILMVFLTISGHPEIFKTIFNQLALPAQFSSFVSKPWTIITHAFVHELTSLIHIFFNMLAFYWFGRLFIEYLGSDKLIAVYTLGILAGATAYLLSHNLIPYYVQQNNGIGFGASAAINAVIVATATLLPDYTFFLFLLGPVRIKYIAAFYVLASFIGTVGVNAGGDVAHLGGAFIGYVYIKQLQVGVNWGGWITSILDWTKSLFTAKPTVKVTYRKQEPKNQKKSNSIFSKASQEEIDSILDKISDKGYESLSKEEKEKLFNASKK
ncbi:MAG: rhomboid family intramembrane serine protease [Flammeovirgaceae bacterium]